MRSRRGQWIRKCSALCIFQRLCHFRIDCCRCWFLFLFNRSFIAYSSNLFLVFTIVLFCQIFNFFATTKTSFSRRFSAYSYYNLVFFDFPFGCLCSVRSAALAPLYVVGMLMFVNSFSISSFLLARVWSDYAKLNYYRRFMKIKVVR